MDIQTASEILSSNSYEELRMQAARVLAAEQARIYAEDRTS